MNEKYLDRLIRESSSGSDNVKKTGRKPVSRPPVKSYSFGTYWKIKHERVETRFAIFAWSAIYAVCFLSLFYFFVIPVSAPVIYLRALAVILCSLCIIRIFYYHIKTVVTYPSYFRWERRMPFNVYGWADLLQYDGFFNNEKWMHKCIITISVRATSEYYTKALKASMGLFCRNANIVYDRYHSDTLRKWDFDNNVLDGSCNCVVAGIIYRYITGDLKKIHNITQMIESVSIITDNKILVAPEIETSNTAEST